MAIEAHPLSHGRVGHGYRAGVRIVTRLAQFLANVADKPETLRRLYMAHIALAARHGRVHRGPEHRPIFRGMRIVAVDADGSANIVRSVAAQELIRLEIMTLATQFITGASQKSAMITPVGRMTGSACLRTLHMGLTTIEQRLFVTLETRDLRSNPQQAGKFGPMRVVTVEALSSGRRVVQELRFQSSHIRAVARLAQPDARLDEAKRTHHPVGLVTIPTISVREGFVPESRSRRLHFVAAHALAPGRESTPFLELGFGIDDQGAHRDEHRSDGECPYALADYPMSQMHPRAP